MKARTQNACQFKSERATIDNRDFTTCPLPMTCRSSEIFFLNSQHTSLRLDIDVEIHRQAGGP